MDVGGGISEELFVTAVFNSDALVEDQNLVLGADQVRVF